MPELRCPNCGQSSAPVLADRWARLLEPEQLTLADSREVVSCPACGHGLSREPRRFRRPTAAQLGALVIAFLTALLGAGAWAYFSAGPR